VNTNRNAAAAGVVIDALADHTRRSVFDLLCRSPRAVGELAAELPVSRPAVSQHLKVLKGAGLVREEAKGTRRIYSVEVESLEPLRDYIESVWDEALGRFENAANERAGAARGRRMGGS
jgi:DNA-binding transcriptional ArsR family regulator